MLFTVGSSFFPAVMAAGGYTDIKEVMVNALGTVIGGLFLTLLYLALGDKLLRLPRLSGAWVLESVVSQTKYNPFMGMVLRYKILLSQDGTRLHESGEKIYEKSDKERVFTGINRTTATIDGTIHKAYTDRSTIVLHVVENGKQRSFSRIYGSTLPALWPTLALNGAILEHCRRRFWDSGHREDSPSQPTGRISRPTA